MKPLMTLLVISLSGAFMTHYYNTIIITCFELITEPSCHFSKLQTQNSKHSLFVAQDVQCSKHCILRSYLKRSLAFAEALVQKTNLL